MAEPVLAVDRLTVRFDLSPPWLVRALTRTPRRIVHAVEDVSFAIAPGTTFALVGESGCGKSTIARTVAGIQRPTAGQVRFAGRRGRDLQMVFQDPYASLDPGWRVGRSIAEPIVTHGLLHGRGPIRARVAELLEMVGLSPGDALKRPHQFSGGQRQRIAIARAISSEPAFLVCDEPTSALDVSVQAQIINLLGRLQRRLGLAILLISHNLGVVAHMADALGVMYLGRLVEVGDAADIIATPRHPYTRALLGLAAGPPLQGEAARPPLQGEVARPPLPGEVARPGRGGGRQPLQGEVPSPLAPPPGCAFHPRCPAADARCRIEQPALLPAWGIHVACHAVQEDRLP